LVLAFSLVRVFLFGTVFAFSRVDRVVDVSGAKPRKWHAKAQRSPISMGTALSAHYVDYEQSNPTCG